MNWRRKKIVTIAPAEKVTWDTLKDEEVSELCRWFGQQGAEIFLRLLASDQDNALRRAAHYARDGEGLKAAVEATKAESASTFAFAQAKAMTLREENA